jgi:hypothetical protein
MGASLSKRKVDSLYLGKTTLFKILLLVGAAIISASFIWYTFKLIDVLKKDTREQVDKYVRMWQLAANSNMSGPELQFIFDEIIVKANFPIVVLDSDRNPILSRNIKGIQQGDLSEEAIIKLKKISDKMIKQNGTFTLVYTFEADSFYNYFCYGDSDVINKLKLMPFLEIGIIVAFMIVAFIGFQNIRRSEERHIWVGMAKETAHQLGTPISSLMGWLEVMDSEIETENSQIGDKVKHMRHDVSRLEKIANRFSKIGSVPELEHCQLNDLIQDTVDYFRRRLPFEGDGVRIELKPNEIPLLNLNPELFGWALENMVKNALQSIDSKNGSILIETGMDEINSMVRMSITDNGKGMSASAARKIFNAGFTTKKRGWGLGLTLVKRIIEEYHRGFIYLKKSKPGETVFEILLPVKEIDQSNE